MSETDTSFDFGANVEDRYDPDVAPASTKQTWCLYRWTGYDVRPCELTVKEASEIIHAIIERDGWFDIRSIKNADRMVKRYHHKRYWADRPKGE
jgi:hypothetical protein